jgi:hypothetical protein
MSSVKTLPLIAFSAFAVAAFGISPGSAQTTMTMPGFTASTPSSVPGCPYIIWRLARDGGGNVRGVAYYSDLSGMSSVTGQRRTNGNFTLNVTPTSMGAGPSGTVTGRVDSYGSIQARMVGSGCANMNGTIQANADLNSIPRGGNGGG